MQPATFITTARLKVEKHIEQQNEFILELDIFIKWLQEFTDDPNIMDSKVKTMID